MSKTAKAVSVKIDPNQYQTLRATAQRRGMLISALLKKILAQYFGDPAETK